MVRGIYVERQCARYDAGVPFWPCEAPDFALKLLSAPPIVIAQPLANSWRTAPSYFAYIVELPLILLWWWFVGTRLDYGILGVGRYRLRRVWLSFFIAAFALLLAFFGWSQWEDVQFYRTYPYLDGNPYLASIKNLRLLPSRVWLLVLILAISLAALRVARGRTGQTDRKLASSSAIRLSGLGLALYCVCATGAVWHSKLEFQRRVAEYDLHHIKIQGRVLDDRGLPVYTIEVDLVPVLENGEAPHWVADPDFTNENGEYMISPWKAGRYLLSVQWNAPPSGRHPFLARYYTDSADPEHAETLEITPEQHLTLNPMRLQRLGLGKVPVSVAWSDGKPEPDAYLLFMNTQYPNSGAIGSEALHPDADGTVSLPVGFEYSATAQVDCDAVAKIESAYTPRVTFSLKSAGGETQPLHCVLPGSPCRVWHPQWVGRRLDFRFLFP